jgi:hypothetical protein
MYSVHMKPYPAFEASPKIPNFEEMCMNWTWRIKKLAQRTTLKAATGEPLRNIEVSKPRTGGSLKKEELHNTGLNISILTTTSRELMQTADNKLQSIALNLATSNHTEQTSLSTGSWKYPPKRWILDCSQS